MLLDKLGITVDYSPISDAKLLQLLSACIEGFDGPLARLSEFAHHLDQRKLAEVSTPARENLRGMEDLRKRLVRLERTAVAELGLGVKPEVPSGTPAWWFARVPLGSVTGGKGRKPVWPDAPLEAEAGEFGGSASEVTLLKRLLIEGGVLDEVGFRFRANSKVWRQSEVPVTAAKDGILSAGIDVRPELRVVIVWCWLNPGLSAQRESDSPLQPDGSQPPQGLPTLNKHNWPKHTAESCVTTADGKPKLLVFDSRGKARSPSKWGGVATRWLLFDLIDAEVGWKIATPARARHERMVTFAGVDSVDDQTLSVRVDVGVDSTVSVPMGRAEYARLEAVTGPLAVGDDLELDTHWDGEVFGVKRTIQWPLPPRKSS